MSNRIVTAQGGADAIIAARAAADAVEQVVDNAVVIAETILAKDAANDAAAAAAILTSQLSITISPGFVNGQEVKYALVDKNFKVLAYINQDEVYRWILKIVGNVNGIEEDLANEFPEVFALCDKDGRVILQVANDRTFIPNLTMPDGVTTFEENLNGYLLRSLTDIVCYGDSLTAGGQGATGKTYPTLLQTILTNRVVQNFGIGSQTAQQISARFGAEPVLFKAVDDEIKGLGVATSLEPPNIDLLLNFGARQINGWFNGIYGLLNRTGGTDPAITGQYTFLPGKYLESSIPVPNPVQFIVDATSQRQKTVIIWIGRNNVTSAGADLVNIVEKAVVNMIEACTVIKPNFIVCSVINATNEDNTTSEYANIYEANDKLRQRYGNRFYDGLSFLPKNENGTIQAEFMADVVHLNDAGYTIWAENLVNHIIRNGF